MPSHPRVLGTVLSSSKHAGGETVNGAKRECKLPGTAVAALELPGAVGPQSPPFFRKEHTRATILIGVLYLFFGR